MARITPNRIARGLRPVAAAERFFGIRVGIIAVRAAGGDMDPQAVALVKNDARGKEIDVEGVNLARAHQLLLAEGIPQARPQAALADVQRTPVRIDIAQPHKEIGVGRVT